MGTYMHVVTHVRATLARHHSLIYILVVYFVCGGLAVATQERFYEVCNMLFNKRKDNPPPLLQIGSSYC